MNKNNLNSEDNGQSVVYWMSRDQRVGDNWAFIHAYNEALRLNKELRVVFNLYQKTKHPQERHTKFMIGGLKEVEEKLSELNIHFDLLVGDAQTNIIDYCKNLNVSILVTDFSPLKHISKQQEILAKKLKIPFVQVDTHNIIPAWITSNKQEYAARTIRPKIHKLIDQHLDEFPQIGIYQLNKNVRNKIEWNTIINRLNLKNEAKEILTISPGEKSARIILDAFLQNKLKNYSQDRNNANLNATSNLSPYMHFGQISAQRVVLEIIKKTGQLDKDNAFFEELVVRRELAENYCFYNEDYDNPNGYPNWAKKTLAEHRKDPREYIYTLDILEAAKTHDELWNAAQQEMVNTGKMHGYLRMYWAKKLLEWTPNVETAHKYAIYLNDKYELDGRDANGYTGIAWALGGVHDRPWFNKEIYGNIRYMARSGCEKKFDVEKYISNVANDKKGTGTN